jgi:hypothetical protein
MIKYDKMFGIIKINYKYVTKSSPQVNPQFHVMSFLICVRAAATDAYHERHDMDLWIDLG